MYYSLSTGMLLAAFEVGFTCQLRVRKRAVGGRRFVGRYIERTAGTEIISLTSEHIANQLAIIYCASLAKRL